MVAETAASQASQTANYFNLIHAIQVLRHQLDPTAPTPLPVFPNPSPATPAALDRLCTLFHLSPFERDLLLLCVAVELDPSFAELCSQLQSNTKLQFPTFHLALSVLPQPHWSAFTPTGNLRRWHLIDLGAGQTLMQSPVKIDERILHYVVGSQSVEALDRRLTQTITPVDTNTETSDLVPSHHQIVDRIAHLWTQSPHAIVQLYGHDRADQRAIATASLRGRSLFRLTASALPTCPDDLNLLIQLWNREAQLVQSALLIEPELNAASSSHSALIRLIDRLQSPLIVLNQERDRSLFAEVNLSTHRPLLQVEVLPATVEEQTWLWHKALKDRDVIQAIEPEQLESQIDQLVNQFNLNALAIQTISTEVRDNPSVEDTSSVLSPQSPLSQILWNLCRQHARPRLDDLAQRIDTHATWDDLILPDLEATQIKTLVAHIRQRFTVYQSWGFATKSQRGLGISALFQGKSGTGKTTAAEIIAKALHLDLYRIDLSQVVSKYIGETEKNLRSVFDAAEAGGVVLLFDEADALFGKRSDVKDSHDRYANMEVSYLLQKMEAYQGLAILTTNLRETMDSAFVRRIRFIVKFSLPDYPQRKAIWERMFPVQMPQQELHLGRLARLNVTGGSIKNIALNAAFLAAEAGEAVQMKHCLVATRSEYKKLEQLVTEAEIEGWV
jgi:hypothetical protein